MSRGEGDCGGEREVGRRGIGWGCGGGGDVTSIGVGALWVCAESGVLCKSLMMMGWMDGWMDG
jgi:hypothetical protein